MKPRRGFTVLELVLATVIASLVLLTAFSLFSAADRSDKRLGARYQSAADIELTRLAFQNALSSLVMSSATPPSRAGNNAGNNVAVPVSGDTAGDPNDPNVGLRSGGKSPGANQKPQPPRLVLAPDDDRSLSGTGMSPQRLEVVVLRSPVPVVRRPEQNLREEFVREEASERIDTSSRGGSQAVRGAFMLRPQIDPPAADVRPDAGDMWELWWVPLPPAKEDPDAPDPPLSMASGYPLRLCKDIASLSIKAFREGEWRQAHTATWFQELPAYVEIDLRLGNGLAYRWMMEIGYFTGAEVTAGEDEIARGRDAEGSASGSGATGSGGAINRQFARPAATKPAGGGS